MSDLKPNFAACRKLIPAWLRGYPIDLMTPEMIRGTRAHYERNKMRRFRIDRCSSRFRVLHLDQLRGLPRVLPSDYESGVYFLWRGPRLMYIGKSDYVRDRITSHRRAGREFTHATFEALNRNCTLECEARYIKRYKPPMNKVWCR